MMSDTAPLLEVSGLTKRFGGLVAVREIGFNIRGGEVLGLIGPNGSGKSTVMTRFLMCAPELYEVEYVINPWMVGQVHAASRERAATQWNALYSWAISIKPRSRSSHLSPGSPDMVFTANAGLAYHRSVALSSFFHPESARAKNPTFRRWFERAGRAITSTSRAPLPSKARATPSSPPTVRCSGPAPAAHPRRQPSALRDAWNIDVVPLTLVDPRFLPPRHLLRPARRRLRHVLPRRLRRRLPCPRRGLLSPEKRISVEEDDAVRFACNVVNIDRTLILNRMGGRLRSQLEALAPRSDPARTLRVHQGRRRRKVPRDEAAGPRLEPA